jgi:hypothetical protein
MTTIDICPACGYPKFGGGLCAYCLPVQAVADKQTSVPAADGHVSVQREHRGIAGRNVGAAASP